MSNSTPETPMTLDDFFNDQYLPIRLLGRSKRTVVLYRSSIRLFEKGLGRKANLDDLRDLTVSKHLQELEANGYSLHSVEKERCQLLAMWRLACDRKLVDLRPTIQKIQAPDSAPLAWKRQELEILFAACKAAPGKIGKHKAADWWFALHCVLWDSGERINAVMLAKWEQIRSDGMIVFPAEHRKCGKRANRRQLHPETIEALDKIKGASDSKIFEWPYRPTYLYYRYGKLLKGAGLPSGRKSKFHRMRRSVGTHFRAAGGDARSALTHREESTTERYIDTTIAEEEQPVDRLFRVRDPGESIEALALVNRFIKRNREWLNEDEVAFLKQLEAGTDDVAIFLRTTRQEVGRKLNANLLEPGITDTKKRRMVSTVSVLLPVVLKRRAGAGCTEEDEEMFSPMPTATPAANRMTLGEWSNKLKKAMEAAEHQMAIGDLLQYGQNWFDMNSRELVDIAIAQTGLPRGTLKNWKSIASGFPMSIRRHCVSWSQYTLIRYLPEDEKLACLQRIEHEHLTYSQLRDLLSNLGGEASM